MTLLARLLNARLAFSLAQPREAVWVCLVSALGKFVVV